MYVLGQQGNVVLPFLRLQAAVETGANSMQVNNDPGSTSQKKGASPPAPAKPFQLPPPRAADSDVYIVITGHNDLPTSHSSTNTTVTRHRPNDSLSASLRRKFKEVKNSGLALRRSISSAGNLKPSVQRIQSKKHRRSKSESLGQGSSSGPHHLQGLGDSSTLSLSPGISESKLFHCYFIDIPIQFKQYKQDVTALPLSLTTRWMMKTTLKFRCCFNRAHQ